MLDGGEAVGVDAADSALERLDAAGLVEGEGAAREDKFDVGDGMIAWELLDYVAVG